MNNLRSLYIFLITMTLITLLNACTDSETPPPPKEQPPLVTIISGPILNETFTVNQEVKIQSTSVHVKGISRVELQIDGQVIWRDANPQPEPNAPYIVVQPWTPDLPGSYLIQVRAYASDDIFGDSNTIRVEVAPPATTSPLLPTKTIVAAPETVSPSPTERPTATDTIEPSPTPLPSATLTPKPIASPTSTPTPGIYNPTGLEPDGRFRDLWRAVGAGEDRLGYPTSPELSERNFAKQYFEQGMMIWWDNPDGPNYIWVIDTPLDDPASGQHWNRYEDTWDNEQDEYGCNSARANGDLGPLRGFGKLWCEQPELQRRLGQPREREAGSGGNAPFAHVQFYQGGTMVYNPLNSEVFVLFDQGDWMRFGY